MRFSSPGQTRRRLTEKRILAGRLTEKRSLWLRRDGKAQSGPRPQGTPHGKAHSARWASRKSALCWLGARRMRLSVTSNPRMRFSVECAFPHLGKRGVASRKSALWQAGSRKSALWLAPATAHLTEKRILHMTAHSTSPSGTVELCKPGARFRALRRALPLRTSTARLSVTYRRPVPPAHLRPSPALPCGLRTHQCPPARSAARTRAPQPRPTYARKETDHEGIRATA